MKKAFLVSFDLESLEFVYRTIPLPFDADANERSPLQVTKDAIYVIGETKVIKWDRRTDVWTQLDLPDYHYRGTILNGSLYLLFDFRGLALGVDLRKQEPVGGGILRHDLATEKTEVLASSRRRPAKTRLDAREPYLPLTVFRDSTGTLATIIEDRTTGDHQVFRATADGDWEEVVNFRKSSDFRLRFTELPDGILACIGNYEDRAAGFELVPLAPGGASVQGFLSRPGPDKPVLPDAVHWDEAISGETRDACYYNARLYLLTGRYVQDDYGYGYAIDHAIRIFSPGEKTSVSIPIQFQLSESDKARILADKLAKAGSEEVRLSIQRRALKEVLTVNEMLLTPEGIILYAYQQPGFWFLPMKEIEAYLKSQ